MGGLSAIIPVIIPLITKFLKNKSGEDLAGMVDGNSDVIQQVIGMLASGQISIGAAPGASNMATSNNSNNSAEVMGRLFDLQSMVFKQAAELNQLKMEIQNIKMSRVQ